MLVGVDEAGRGPVLGSMFVAAVAVQSDGVLPKDVRDSKLLTDPDREHLATAIRDVATDVACVELTADDIDEDGRDLNRLTLAASADAVEQLLPAETDGSLVIADACDVNASRYRRRLASRLPDQLGVHARHAADSSEPIVGAASILAKSERESHVARLREKYGDLGSGYPSDPTTRAFLVTYLERNGDLPSCARRSWRTSRDLLGAAAQGTLAEF